MVSPISWTKSGFENPINLKKLRSGMKDKIEPGTEISSDDKDLIDLFHKKKGLNNDTVATYGDLWKITGCDAYSIEYKVLNLAKIYRLIYLAAHFGNSNNPTITIIKHAIGGEKINVWIFSTQEMSYNTICQYFNGAACCICTGSSTFVEKVRDSCEDKCRDAIFVENIYDKSNEKGTIRIREEVGSEPTKEKITWQAGKAEPAGN